MLTLLAFADAAHPAMEDLAIVLAVAGLAVIIMGRFGMATIPAFLVAGAVSGPYALGLIHSPDTLATISDLAIILMLFSIGLHLDPHEIRTGSKWMFMAAALSILVSIAALWPLAMLWGLGAAPALAVAMALSLSSTALVTRRLMKQRALRLPAGRLAIIVLVMQDLAVPLMLIVLSLLVHSTVQSTDSTLALPEHEPAGWLAMARSAAMSLGGLGVLIVVGRWLLPRMLKSAAAIGGDEVLLTLGLAAAIGFSLLTQLLGFSYELGAFLAGLILGSTPFRLQLGALLSPARDFFLAVFFTTLGMAINPAALADLWLAIILGSLALASIKSVAIAASAWAAGATGPVASTTGLTLAQGGEFSLVLLQAASAAALLTVDQTSAAVAIVVISLILAPLPILASTRLERLASKLPRPPWLRVPPPQSTPTSDSAPHEHRVIIAGFGPVGQVAAEALEGLDLHITVIELNPATVHTHSALGRNVVFGDVSRTEVLEAAGVPEAHAIIITIPDERAAMRACQHAKELNPKIRVIARFPFLGKGLLAKSMGADEIVVDEVATASVLQRLVVEYLDLPPETPAPEQPQPEPRSDQS